MGLDAGVWAFLRSVREVVVVDLRLWTKKRIFLQ